MSIDAAIVDYSAALLLRYFRNGAAIDGSVPRVDARRDLDLLKCHWAMSQPVRLLVSYLLDRPHEAQSLLTYRERVDDAVARGRIDARRTWLYRRQSGLSSALVTHEPVRSFNTGPNLLLAWVLREAATFTARLSSWQGSNSPYLTPIENAQADMRKVQRIEGLREPLRAVSLGQRPGTGAVRDCARSRRPVYRLALDAYRALVGLEQGNPEAILRVARTALIAPLEDWRRFELAVGLSVCEALSKASNAPLQLHLLGGDSSGPIATAGKYAVFWQQITSYHNKPDLEASELAAKAALEDYGLHLGTERPDLIVVDRDRASVVSVVEVKYVAGDTASARFKEAMDQVVRYGRSYAPVDQREKLLTNSLIAISRDAPARVEHNSPAPFSADFERLKRSDGLDRWAASVMIS